MFDSSDDKLNEAMRRLDELTNKKFSDFGSRTNRDFDRIRKQHQNRFDEYTNRFDDEEWSFTNSRNNDVFEEDKPFIINVIDTILTTVVTVFNTIKKSFFTQSGGNGNNNNNKPPILKGITDMFKNVSMKLKLFVALVLLVIVLSPFLVGVNDAGNRTVIQYPTGTLKVKFTAGVYPKLFGKSTTYSDVITFDFDKKENPDNATLEQIGIPVRYQDGGMGTTFGIIRFALPSDIDSMIAIHKDFKSNAGLANKLLKAISEESMNLTAGLMSSEAAYAEKRGTFSDWARSQIKNGPFITRLGSVDVTDEETGKKVTKMLPVIVYEKDNITPRHNQSDLKKYGVTVSGIQIVDWDFEPKTLAQIAAKREATMAIITAKATAEKAKQDAITSEQQGLADVMKAKYEEEVEKQKAIVQAEKAKEVAVIAAQQLVEVATQEKLEAEQKKLTAKEYKQEQVLRGEGDAAYKKLVMQADGALQQKLDAYVTVNGRYAEAIESQKWVPEIQMGTGTGTDGGSTAMSLIEMLAVKTAKDLSLDLNVTSK